MHSIASRIARWLAPYLVKPLSFEFSLKEHSHTFDPEEVESLIPYLQQIAAGHTITRQMIEDLANDLGREITFDLQTGAVTIHALKR